MVREDSMDEVESIRGGQELRRAVKALGAALEKEAPWHWVVWFMDRLVPLTDRTERLLEDITSKW